MELKFGRAIGIRYSKNFRSLSKRKLSVYREFSENHIPVEQNYKRQRTSHHASQRLIESNGLSKSEVPGRITKAVKIIE